MHFIYSDIPNAINAVYFWLSLAFIMSRTLAMLFCAASVNDASRRPIAVLRNVPCSAWNVEVQRFTAQCTTGDVVALSGKRFFYLTRSLILAVCKLGMGGLYFEAGILMMLIVYVWCTDGWDSGNL